MKDRLPRPPAPGGAPRNDTAGTRLIQAADRIIRISLTLLILAGTAWLGITLSPTVRAGRATVTDQIASPPPVRTSLPGISWEGTREFLVNGGRLAIARGKTKRENHSGLWPGLKKYSGEIIAGGEGEGFLAGLPLGRGRALNLLARGHDAGGLVSAFLVLPREGSGADIFSFSASGLGLSNFLASGGNDAPGRDPAGLPRLPLSRRLVSIQDAGPAPSLQIAAYLYPGSAEAARRFYRARLAEEGWERPAGADGSDSLIFRRGKSLLSIGISPDPEEAVLITAAMITQ